MLGYSARVLGLGVIDMRDRHYHCNVIVYVHVLTIVTLTTYTEATQDISRLALKVRLVWLARLFPLDCISIVNVRRLKEVGLAGQTRVQYTDTP